MTKPLSKYAAKKLLTHGERYGSSGPYQPHIHQRAQPNTGVMTRHEDAHLTPLPQAEVFEKNGQQFTKWPVIPHDAIIAYTDWVFISDITDWQMRRYSVTHSYSGHHVRHSRNHDKVWIFYNDTTLNRAIDNINRGFDPDGK